MLLKRLPKNTSIVIAVLFSLSVITLICCIIIANEVNTSARLVSRTEEVLFRSQKLLTQITHAETSARAYLLTGKPYYLQSFQKSKGKLPLAMATLWQLTLDNNAIQKNISQLVQLVNERLTFSDSILKLNGNRDVPAMVSLLGDGRSADYLDKVEKIAGQIEAGESNILTARQADNHRKDIVQIYFFAAFIVLLAALCFVLLKSGNILMREEERRKADIRSHKTLEETLRRQNEILEQKIEERTREISRSEKRCRALIENSNDVIILMDSSLKIVYRSPTATRVSGWTNEEILGKSATQNVHPDENMYDAEILKELKENPGKPIKTIFRNLHKNGNYIWAEGVVMNLLHDEDVQAIVCNFRDVTERVEAEEKLVASETRFRLLIENSTEGIALIDAGSNVIYCSPASQKIPGLIGGDPSLHEKHPCWKYLQSVKVKIMENPGLPVDFLGQFYHPDGYYFWQEGTFTNLLDVKGVNAIVANYRDVTKRKEAEEKLVNSERLYKTIASSIPGSVICLFDTDFRYLLIEGDFLENLGYSKDKLLGKLAGEVLPPEVYKGVLVDFEQAKNGQIFEREATMMGYDIITRFIPLKEESDLVYAIMTVTLDVTPLKKVQREIVELNYNLEEKIIKRTEELRKSNAELEAFSYSISHDLRAPLRAIIGFSAILEDDYVAKLDSEAKRIISIIKANTLKMGNLIDDLLRFSRTSRQHINKSVINTDEMVRGIISEVLNARQADSTVEFTIETLPEVYGDANTIRQVWVNLINNAVKYSGKNARPKIEVRSYVSENETVFFIKDNGVGFDETYKDKLFKVFQRLHLEADFEGTGIGLAIVDKVISRHGGRVWANGIEGEGATFYFTLPLEGNGQ